MPACCSALLFQRVVRVLGAASLAALLLIAPAGAQTYPSKPVRIIIPFAPGGGTDVSIRALSGVLSEALGQSVVVENRPGGGGNLGADLAVKADPDGYTLFAPTDSHTVAPALFPKLNYDLVKDFLPVTKVAQGPYVLVAHPSLPVSNVKEFIAYVKERPNQIPYASSGAGTAAHLSGEMFKMQAGLVMDHVSYKGGGAAIADLVGGHVKVGILGLAGPMPHIKSGALKPLGVTSATRHPLLPDVPTFAESGLPGFDTQQWLGILVPKGTPSAVIARLHADIVKAAQNPAVVERIAASGLQVTTSASPQEFGKFLVTDMEQWPPVVKASGAKPE